MSRRRRVVLIAITWTVAIILCIAYPLWPAYRNFSDQHQWYYGLILGAVLGWASNDIIRRRK